GASPRAELALEALRRRVLGERAEELDRLGDLVGRDRLAADLLELRRRDAPALLQHDERLHGLPAQRVGDAHDRGLPHRLVAEEHLLDLAWEDIEARNVDHVLNAADEAIVAVR